MEAFSFIYNLPGYMFGSMRNASTNNKIAAPQNGNNPGQISLRVLSGLSLGLGLTMGPQIIKRHYPTIASSLRSLKHNLPDTTLPVQSLPFASASLVFSDAGKEETQNGFVKEPLTEIEFPSLLHDSSEKQLAGLGVRNKSLFGLKNIRIYAFGVYANPSSVKSQLIEKYGDMPLESIESSKWFMEDVIASDSEMTVRLVIHYKRLKISQVRNAFEESLGGRLKSQSSHEPTDNVLKSFTTLFKDELILHRGTEIDISRRPGQVLETKIDGKVLGSVKSAALCKAFFSLYIGESPFDAKAKELASKHLSNLFA